MVELVELVESVESGKWEVPFLKLPSKKFLHIRFGKFFETREDSHFRGNDRKKGGNDRKKVGMTKEQEKKC